MKTKKEVLLLFFLIIHPLLINAATLVAPSKVIITYNSKSIYPFSYLKINRSFLGRIYRGARKIFYFPPNEKLNISLYHKKEIATTNINTKPGKIYQINLRLNLYSKEDILSDNLIIFLKKESTFNYAYIAIDEKHYGFIRKDNKRHFFISPGKHIITVYRFGTKKVQEITIYPDKRIKLNFTLNK